MKISELGFRAGSAPGGSLAWVVSSLLCKLCSLVLGLRFGAGFESAPAIPAPEPALGSHPCVALYSGSGTFQFRPAILALNALNPRGSGTESPIQ